MKKIFTVIVAIIVIAGIQSCKKVDDLKTSIENQSISLPFNGVVLHEKIDATSAIGQFTIKENDVYLDIDSLLTANKVDRSKIKGLKLQQITFTITEGAENFNFLKSMESRFAVGSATTTSVATVNPVAKDVSTFTVNVDNLDMKPYIDQKYFTFEFVGETQSAIANPIKMDVSFKYQLDAYLLK